MKHSILVITTLSAALLTSYTLKADTIGPGTFSVVQSGGNAKTSFNLSDLTNHTFKGGSILNLAASLSGSICLNTTNTNGTVTIQGPSSMSTVKAKSTACNFWFGQNSALGLNNNTSNVVIKNINFQGQSSGVEYGIGFNSGSNITIQNVSVTGFTKNTSAVALMIQSGSNITVENSSFSLNSNGIWIDEQTTKNSTISSVHVHNNQGAGIYIGYASGVTVKNSSVHNNAINPSLGNRVGIETSNSDHLLITGNEVFNNVSTNLNLPDSDGIDFDNGTTASIASENYTHGNQGAGVALFDCNPAAVNKANLVLNNFSVNDGIGEQHYGGHSTLDVCELRWHKCESYF